MNFEVNLHKNLVLRNPIMTASGTFGYGHEFMPYGELSSLGAIIVKGLSLKARHGNPMPRIAESPCGMLNAIGLQNDGVDYFINKHLAKLEAADVPVIANIYAACVDDFAQLAKILSQEKRVAAVEVNISCPNVSEGGVLFGQDPLMAAKLTEAVKLNAGDLPVIVKLSPNVTDIGQIAQAVESAGADIISCINTVTAMSVDIYSRRPRLANIVGGLSGAAIKPIALKAVWQVAKVVKIPIIGIGGIYSAEDVMEYILVGASAVQVGTANLSDPSTVFAIARDLPSLCNKLAIENLDEYRGSLLV